MIDKVANNKYNTEVLKLFTPEEVKKKLDYYRSFLGKIQDLSDDEFENLQQSIKTFFNLKPVKELRTPPEKLIRISNNNRILKAQGKELSYLTEIDQLLAPPPEYCNYGRCNILDQQVLYCAINESLAYWETKPKNGDVITISHFRLKEGAKLNCTVISSEKRLDPDVSNELQEIHDLLDDFFVDVYSIVVSMDRPKDYLFSALLSSDQLFYPIASDLNIEAVVYPSVQKKKFGYNVAIRNDLIFEKYDLEAVETRFILDEFDKIDPSSDELTTDNLIASFVTNVFDFDNGKILYKDKTDEFFDFLRSMQTSGGKQTRNNDPDLPKNMPFDFSPVKEEQAPKILKRTKFGRNERIDVLYNDGTLTKSIKFKKVESDLENNLCKVIESS